MFGGFRENAGLQARDPYLLRGGEADRRPLPRGLGTDRLTALGRLLPDRGEDGHRLRQRRGGLCRPARRQAGDALADRARRPASAAPTTSRAGSGKPFAVRDGRLITGQQQYSGGKVAELVIEALGR